MAGVTSVRTRQFKKLFTRLPQHIQEIAQRKFELFLQDPHHPSFHRKIIQSTSHLAHPYYEFRITRNYRATCFMKSSAWKPHPLHLGNASGCER